MNLATGKNLSYHLKLSVPEVWEDILNIFFRIYRLPLYKILTKHFSFEGTDSKKPNKNINSTMTDLFLTRSFAAKKKKPGESVRIIPRWKPILKMLIWQSAPDQPQAKRIFDIREASLNAWVTNGTKLRKKFQLQLSRWSIQHSRKWTVWINIFLGFYSLANW